MSSELQRNDTPGFHLYNYNALHHNLQSKISGKKENQHNLDLYSFKGSHGGFVSGSVNHGLNNHHPHHNNYGPSLGVPSSSGGLVGQGPGGAVSLQSRA